MIHWKQFLAAVLAAAAAGVVAPALGQDTDTEAGPATEASTLVSTPASLAYLQSPLTLTDADGHSIHVMPTLDRPEAAVAAADPGPLVYHAGGSIMPRVQIFNIFWDPGKLQTGAPSSMVSGYQTILNNLAADFVGHSISSITTQYSQTISGVTTFVSGLPSAISGVGSLGGTYVDTAAYPASGCKDKATPGNCITDTQLTTELLRVMKLKAWTGGLNKIYLVYLASGEGSCFTSASTSCWGTYYCAYHSHVLSGTTPVIYGNIGYDDVSGCAAGSSPNANPVADAGASTVSHEVSEAITDPLGNAWITAQGNEIGDLCAYNYGVNTFDGGLANEWWNGHYYELQREYDNHYLACTQAGP